MEISMVFELAKTFGVGGVFLWAAFYLMKRLEVQFAQEREQSLKREERMVIALTESQVYTRGTMAGVIERNTAAMSDMAATFEGLACRDLRREDLKPVIDNARRRAGEG